MLPIKIRKVSIVEDGDGWTFNNDMVYQSAMAALLAIKREDEDVGNIVTIIEWTATSRIGRAVLAVLTDS